MSITAGLVVNELHMYLLYCVCVCVCPALRNTDKAEKIEIKY